ncbi:hypothetical protein DENSPDRAFT_843202 [Dentipellis sp. KUC8613]|nr:hypothetical protein DENSPDRAFT_843202 [Dentipellis sp. KUC8613]
MSSPEDDAPPRDAALSQPKKRRVQSQRACDRCRQKKVRCNGAQKPGRCSTCEAYDYECTYNEAAKKRGPSKRYVDTLEARLEKMEDLLKKAYPENGDSPSKDGGQRSQSADYARMTPPRGGGPPTTTHSSPGGATEDQEFSDDCYEPSELVQHQLSALCLHPMSNRFFGKSSGATLLQTALDLKSEYSGVKQEPMGQLGGLRRRDAWAMHPWEIASFQPRWRGYTYPPPDLLVALIELFFANINIYMPLLHRPTFEAAVADGLQYRDAGFGGVLLLVCATAAHFSDDERVLLPGTGEHWHSCGWQWFDQVQLTHRSILAAGCLCDLQIYALAVLFLHGCSPPHACWTTVGIGIRLAQDVGAHRQKMYSSTPNTEDELLKRAFWVLIVLDRWLSSILGRPLSISEEDYDVEYPIECDDEYWDHPDPELNFKQPADKPSVMAHFTTFLRLTAIHSYALKTIYATNKSRVMHGYGGEEWEQHVVADIDSQLNSWLDSMPEHLRWDPRREDDVFLAQSGSLYSCYYYVQIQVHRPFIPSVRKPSSLSFPSLAICTNAARSCAHLVDVVRKRIRSAISPNFQVTAFLSGIVLLVSLWGAKRSGLTLDPDREMQDVYKCIQLMNDSEPRWHIAGRLRDLLIELSTISELPIPQHSPPAHAPKRRASGSDVLPALSAASTPAASASVSASASGSTPAAATQAQEFQEPFIWDPAQTQERPVAGSRRAMQAAFGDNVHAFEPPSVPVPVSKTSRCTQSQTLQPSRCTQTQSSTPGHIQNQTQGQDAEQDTAGAGYAYLPTPTAEPLPFARPNFAPSPGHLNGPQFVSMFEVPSVGSGPGPGDASGSGSGEASGSGSGGGTKTGSGVFAYGLGPGSVPPSATSGYYAQGGGYGQYAPGVGTEDAAAFERLFQGLAQDADGQLGVDQDTMMMWSTLPAALEGDDWDRYMSNATGWTHPHGHGHTQPQPQPPGST